MPRLAEEVGLIGGNGLNHQESFRMLLRLCDQLMVVVQAGNLESAESAGESSAKQGFFRTGEPDAAFAVNQLLKTCEQGLSDSKGHRPRRRGTMRPRPADPGRRAG